MSSSNLDIRNHSALMKRAEQLKRWEESDTNKESPHPKPEKTRKIRFPSGCVFLASCLSGDKNEVVTLLEDGADINTANVDGLTALHQVIIDLFILHLHSISICVLVRCFFALEWNLNFFSFFFGHEFVGRLQQSSSSIDAITMQENWVELGQFGFLEQTQGAM